MTEHHVVIYSGGMDSFTLLHHVHDIAYRRSGTTSAVSFDYGQRHKKELRYAEAECARMGIAHHVIDLTSVNALLGGSALTRDEIEVPEGHYSDATMKKTVVPGRNAIMLAIAAGLAESLARNNRPDLFGRAALYYGAHSGDHAIYPDCRPAFFAAMRQTIRESSDGLVHMEAPFLDLDKFRILQRGAELGLTAKDYGRSWTCYKGQEHACGKCGACVERAEAFQCMGWVDPHAA